MTRGEQRTGQLVEIRDGFGKRRVDSFFLGLLILNDDVLREGKIPVSSSRGESRYVEYSPSKRTGSEVNWGGTCA